MYVEQFSILKAPAQAKHARDVVKQSESFLQERNPGALERYGRYAHALKNVVRLARYGQGYNAFLLKEQQGVQVPAIGMASVILGQTVDYQQAGSEFKRAIHRGTAIDYWLRPDMSDAAHRSAAASVYNVAKLKELQVADMGVRNTADTEGIFTIEKNEDDLPVGLNACLKPISEPGSIIRYRGDNTEYGLVPQTPSLLFIVD